MFLFKKIYIIFVLLWVFANYLIFTRFYLTSTENKVREDLQNEINSLKQKLSQLHVQFKKVIDQDKFIVIFENNFNHTLVKRFYLKKYKLN
jgi:uncharacterized membrane protein